MRIKYRLAVVLLLILSFSAGQLLSATHRLDSPAPPADTYSYTLQDIYNRLSAGTAGAQSAFTEPATGPLTGTVPTLNGIMALAPTADITHGATLSDVLTSKAYWSLRPDGAWGTQTGTMADHGAVTLVPTTTNVTIAAGYHDGAGYVEGDADLMAGNILSGTNLFGITGTLSTYDAGVPKTGQTTSYATGDDGDLELGVAWPTPRFIAGTTGTTGVTVVVTDTLTGLVWLQDANCIANQYPGFDNDDTSGDGRVTWQHALDFVAGINAGTYALCGASFDDWRLPNVRELQSLVDYGEYDPALPDGHPFTAVQSSYYWSSTTYANYTSYAWIVNLYYGHVYRGSKTNDDYVWPVRGGQ